MTQLCRDVHHYAVLSMQTWNVLNRGRLHASVQASILSAYTARLASSISRSKITHRQNSLFWSRDLLARLGTVSAKSATGRHLFSTSSSSSFSSSTSPDSTDDYYEILGVTHEATQKDIKAAYIAKSKLYHPDNNPGKETEAHDNFIKVVAAYKTLSSRRHRSEYDVDLENMLRAIRNEAPLTQNEVDDKLKNREKYGFWNSILPYGSSSYLREDEPNWKFVGRATLYLVLGIGTVFWMMKVVEFTYGDIVTKRRRAIARRERMRREIELEQKRQVEVGYQKTGVPSDDGQG